MHRAFIVCRGVGCFEKCVFFRSCGFIHNGNDNIFNFIHLNPLNSKKSSTFFCLPFDKFVNISCKNFYAKITFCCFLDSAAKPNANTTQNRQIVWAEMFLNTENWSTTGMHFWVSFIHCSVIRYTPINKPKMLCDIFIRLFRQTAFSFSYVHVMCVRF